MMSSSLLRLARTATRRTHEVANAHRTMAAAAAVPAPSTSEGAMPSVYDKIVKLTIVDPSGARRIIPGYVGQSLYDACTLNGIDLGPTSVGAPQQKTRSDTWVEPLYGEGPTAGFDHILLQGKGVELAEPPCKMETKMLNEYWDEDELFPESRLATQVEIYNEMDGMVVYVPDRLVDDIP